MERKKKKKRSRRSFPPLGLKGKGQRSYYNPEKSGSCDRGPPDRSCSLKQKKKSLITHDPKGRRSEK